MSSKLEGIGRMGSGAFVVDLSPANWAELGGQPIAQSVPLPPAQNSGGVKFGGVFLSLSASPPLNNVEVRVISGGVTVYTTTVNVAEGRTGIGRVIQPGDESAVITFIAPAPDQTAVAFVEYSTP